MKKIFIGKVTSGKGGVEQLKEGYLTGNDNWFGELGKGDYCFISEDGVVKSISKVTDIEDYMSENNKSQKKYYFKTVRKFDKPIKTNYILSSKYFELGIHINNILKSARPTNKNFYELELTNDYKNGFDIMKINFYDTYREICFEDTGKKINNNHHEGDIIIKVSSKNDGYNILDVFIYNNGKYKKYDLFEKLKNINLNNYGLIKAYEISKKKSFIKEKKFSDIINNLDNLGYYVYPVTNNLDDLYDIFIVDKDSDTSNKNSNESIDKFHDYCNKQGFYYTKKLIRRFITSLDAKRFLLLTGISGTGKTKIAELYGEYLGENKYLKIAVGSNWNDNKKLLGYKNILVESHDKKHYNNGYVKTELVDFIKKANKQKNDCIIIFDEMNLSYVERYFSDFLSALESRDNKIVLPNAEYIKWEDNIKIVGTVNIDETTYMFSPKVLDRANVIEMQSSKPSDYIKEVKDKDKKKDIYNKISKFLEDYSKVLDDLYEATNHGFAYRTIDEISVYIGINLQYDVSWKELLDEQIVQKILPKLHGTSSKIIPLLDKLSDILKDGDFVLSREKIEKMREQSTNGYISFIE